jgi:hypothetical protein
VNPERVAQALLQLDLAAAKLASLNLRPSVQEVQLCNALGDRIFEWLEENNKPEPQEGIGK